MTDQNKELIAELRERADNAEAEGNATARCDAHYFRQAADALEEAGRWLPIESAPKDGTKILIWRDGWLYAPVAWREVIDGEDGSFGAWIFDDGLCLGLAEGVLGWQEDFDEDSMPTHWQPLPPTPNSQKDR